MTDCDNSTLSLDNLKPIVHKVKPLHREASAWHPWTEAPPSFSHISATQDMQDEADSVSGLLGFSDTPEIFFPLHKGSSGLNVLPSTNNSSYYYDSDKEEIETRDSINSAGQYDDLLGGDYCKDVSQSGSDHVTINQRCWSVERSESPPQWGRKSLFKVQVLNNEGQSSTKDDQSGSGSQTASRPQTFLSQVTMATVRPPLQLPRTTVSQAAPPFSPTLCFATPLLPLGSSAPSNRPPQQAAHAGMQDKGTKRVFVPPMTPQPLHVEGSSGSGILRPVSEIPAKFRTVFSEFPFFNYVQSKALDDILYTGKNFVACAPTGSGKTVLFELAIIRLLMKSSEPWREVKAVFMAPIKALCSQCFESWKKKFGPLGLSCKELTGDTEVDDFFDIQDSHIILTTPEKWDSMTRKWKDNSILQLVQLFLIDEVHVVKDATRGATLEVVVSRMKAVNAYRMSLNADTGFSMRFVAVSATIPNISDIADWLSDESGAAKYLDMDESHRPVKLRRVVLGFPCNPKQTEFKFDLSLNYKMANIIQTYSEQKPTLVFCSTRKGVQQSAAVLAKDARFIMSIEHKQRLMKYANSLLDSKLGELVMLGIGYHHAGVDLSDRKLIEKAFTQADLLVLFTTRTLAMGVNLPAHLVVIKSTMQYVGGSCEEYSEADVLQMMGRAGRPQFDTSATAVIMTKIQTRDKYIKLMNGMEIIESSLHSHLVEHLNAEIVLQTISDVNMALDWIRSTFLYIRALKNPTHYGFSAELDRYGIEAKLQELCLKNLNSLSSIGLITMDEDINIKPTDAGRLMARYCVAFDTMTQFTKVVGTENLSDLVELVSKSSEFSDIQLRVNEKRSLNTLNRDKYRMTIRFPIEGKIKTTEMKVNCLIQAQLGCIPIQEFGLNQDTAKIFRNGMRISRCLSEFLSQPSKKVFSALLNSLILAKCFRARIWENSIYVSKQLVKIGQSLASVMVNAGLTSFSKIEQTNPREIELILNRHPPFGNQIRESVIHLPKYEVTLEQLSKYSCETAEVVLKVNLKNQTQLLSRRTAHNQHYASLLIGNSDNTVVFLQKLTDVMLLKCGSWSKKIKVAKASRGEAISVNLISSEYVGLDIQQKFNLCYSGAKKFATDNSYYLTHDRTGQTLQQSKRQAASQKENDTSAAEQDPGSTRQCNHYCKNKDVCGHDCCKVGVNVTRKTSLNQGSPFSSYLRDLRNRTDALTHTPVKRLKMKMSEESASNMQQFIFKHKERLPAFPRSEGIDYDAPVRPSVVDLTTEDWTAVPDVVDLNVYNDDDNVEDVCMMTEELVRKADASHASHQSIVASVWTNSSTHAGVDQDYKMHPDQINTNSSVHVKTSTAASNWKSHCKNPPPSHIPTITFDLGNEWDDWSDFDDENLVRASEKSPASCAANFEPEAQQPIDFNTSAFATSASAICHPQVQPAFVTARTPLRSIPPTLNPGIKKTESSLVTVRTQSRITLDWNKKRSSTFNEAVAVKAPENIPPQAETSKAPNYRRFDFFSRGPAANISSTINTCNSDEKVPFRGIFEGLI